MTVDNIEDEEAARNEAIVIPLQDFNYMERRGYGFNGMVATMREAGLAPPLLRDNGASFDLCLKSHVLMSPETVSWLHQFDPFDLSPREKLALAYLRVNEGFNLRLYNRDYVRLNDCTSVEATQDLRHMVEKKVLEMHGTRGGAHYILPASFPKPILSLEDVRLTEEERILRLAHREGRITVTSCADQLHMNKLRASKLLQRLSTPGGGLQPHQEHRWRYYTPL